MATLDQGIVGGFSGTVGPVVGYQWRGRWCMRSRPASVRNPRTEGQQAHRRMFKEEVLLASRLNRVLRGTLERLSLEAHMTPGNFFIRDNQACFAWQEGALAVEWRALRLSHGPVAPVAFGVPEVTAEGVLTVAFEKNPLHVYAEGHDLVHLAVYCPAAEECCEVLPVFRATRRVSVLLPESFLGQELHVYGMVCDERGRWSETLYVPMGREEEEAEGEEGIEGEAVESAVACGRAAEGATLPGSPVTVTREGGGG